MMYIIMSHILLLGLLLLVSVMHEIAQSTLRPSGMCVLLIMNIFPWKKEDRGFVQINRQYTHTF